MIYHIKRRLLEGALGATNWYVADPEQGERILLGTNKGDAGFRLRRLRREGHLLIDASGLFSATRYNGLVIGDAKHHT